ncbi:MAG: hypothetical protein Q7J10_01920, partial [Methanosarcinaceae archaeon]|nr:hypothetical protein [Methanosarcinaceae archaeon]
LNFGIMPISVHVELLLTPVGVIVGMNGKKINSRGRRERRVVNLYAPLLCVLGALCGEILFNIDWNN